MFLRTTISCCLVMLLAPAAFADAIVPVNSASQRPLIAPNMSVFAFPGKSCPGSSEVYKGPEQTDARSSNAIYCRFVPKAIVLPKRFVSSCPSGMREHIQPGAKPDDDTLWCDIDVSRTIEVGKGVVPASRNAPAVPPPH